MDELLELRARVIEYEHALEHVAEDHAGACPDCRRLARSALDGVNRETYREIAADMVER